MKKLTLIRHAKSSWEGNLDDFDRPLSVRGYKDLDRMVREVKEYNLTLDLVLSSPANRAQTTARHFVEHLQISSEKFTLNQSLYDFSGQKLIETIRNVNQNVEHLMVFGHNHAITYFVNAFGSQYIDNVPTCGLVTIEFQTTKWKEISKGKTTRVLFPKNLRPD